MKQVLVADDDVELAESLRDALSSEYNIELVHSGLQIIEAYKRKKNTGQSYDALILDIDFRSGINGLEAADLIRTQDQEIRILIFSAYDYSDNIKKKVIEIDASFCEKPLEPTDIRNFIEGETSLLNRSVNL